MNNLKFAGGIEYSKSIYPVLRSQWTSAFVLLYPKQMAGRQVTARLQTITANQARHLASVNFKYDMYGSYARTQK